MSVTYENLCKQLTLAEKRVANASARASEIRKKIELERGRAEILCTCGTSVCVSQLELIIEEYGGSFNSRYDDWCSSTREYFVCPSCQDVFANIKNDVFPEGIKKYVKNVHEWDSSNQRCHGRVLELLTPSIEKEKKVAQEIARKVALDSARKLLREAGEFRDS